MNSNENEKKKEEKIDLEIIDGSDKRKRRVKKGNKT